MVIIWSARAKRDFDRLVASTAAHSPKGAQRISSRILKRIADLAEMPFQGSLLPKSLRRLEVTQTPYILIFRANRDDVRIVRILHARRKRRS